MAILSNINGIFDVHSTGAIQFNGNHGTAGQILKSNGNAAPTWVAASTVIGGPYLPLSGGTLTGATATASGISFTVGGVLTVGGTISGSGIELSNYMQIKVDDAEIYWTNTANNDYWRWKRDASNNFICDHYNGSSTTAALTFNSSQNATFAGNVNAGGSPSIAPNTNFDNLVVTESAHSGITILSGNTSDGGIYFGDPDFNGAGQIKYLHASNSMTFTTDNDNATLTLDDGYNATFAGNIMPAAENAQNIGSASVRWEDLYVDDGFIRNAYIDTNIYHNGDTDTYINFTDDTIKLSTAGGFGFELDSNRDINSPDRLYMRQTRFGYSSSYKVVQFGNAVATSAISLGYDPSGNTSGSFSGNEILIPNNIRILAPAANNSGYYGLMMLNSSNKV